MGRQLIVRLLQTVVSLLGMSVLIFVLVRASGDPVDLMRTATTTDADMANMRATWAWTSRIRSNTGSSSAGWRRGDLGKSLIQRRPVDDDDRRSAAQFAQPRCGLAFVSGIGLALVLGVMAATRRDTWLDNGVKFLAILGQALPGFWVAIVAIYIFSVHWQLLPTSGIGGPQHYVLPVLTLAFFLMPGMMRLVRSSMLDVLGSEYVKLARIKGLPERTVIWKHALRNALIAPLTAAGRHLRGPDHWRGDPGDRLCLAGCRPAAGHGRVRSRFPGRAGHHDDGRRGRAADQSAGRHRLRVRRPEDQAVDIWTSRLASAGVLVESPGAAAGATLGHLPPAQLPHPGRPCWWSWCWRRFSRRRSRRTIRSRRR